MKAILAAAVLLALLATINAEQAFAGFFDVETKFTASDSVALDRVGQSVGISSTLGIVGAPAPLQTKSGSAYLFDPMTGVQIRKLKASDASSKDSFGHDVGISGNTSIVGAANSDNGAGSAYIFDNDTGSQRFKLKATDASQGDNFGVSVAINGNTAIVGAYENDSGAAYLFDTTTGIQLKKLSASPTYRFGQSVSIDGNRAIVGSGAVNHAAYIFDTATGQQLFKLTASDAAAGDGLSYFGGEVAISGNLAIVGANHNDSAGTGAGAAYIFDVSTGTELFKLTASDAEAGDRFGDSVAIHGNLAIVGSTFDRTNGNSDGSAYLFDATTGLQLKKLTASDVPDIFWFGVSVAIRDNVALVGATGSDDFGTQSGSAYIFASVPEPVALFLLATIGISYLACGEWRVRRKYP